MNKRFIVFIAAVLSFAACIDEMPTSEVGTPDLYASIEAEDQTKTCLDTYNNVRWSEDDQILAFMKSSLGLKYQIKPAYVGKTAAYFSKVTSSSSDDLGAGVELNHNVVYYPYIDVVCVEKSGDNYVLDAVLPANQNYAVDSFGNGAFPMVAVSEDNDITFNNLCGGIKLQLKGVQSIASIKIEGKNQEKLSGSAMVTAYPDGTKPVITMSSTASPSVILNCGEGVQLNMEQETNFIIALPPIVFSKGFTVTVVDTNGNEQTIDTDKSNEVPRSSLLVMPVVTLDEPVIEPEVPETREGDYVDEYGINHGPGIVIDDLVWAPVNCGYHETDYPYGKLYQWGRKYGQGHKSANITFVKGPVDESYGSDLSRANEFYYIEGYSTYGWASKFSNMSRWNKGTESNPLKSEHDPCPDGWRVPTMLELASLTSHWSPKETVNNQAGKYFSGSAIYSESVPRVFFPAAGYRKAYSYTSVTNAGYELNYATSKKPDYNTYNLDILATYSSGTRIYNGIIEDATSVRCVRIEPPTALEKGETDDETDGDMNSNGTYTVTLVSSETNAKAWQLSSSESSPDPSIYDGVYESTNRTKNTFSTMYIDITNHTSFKFYVRCDAESFDFIQVSELDKTPSPNTYSGGGVKASVDGHHLAGTGTASINDYTLVEFTDIEPGTHRITIRYIKDDEDTSGDDRGYVIIPREYNRPTPTGPKSYTVDLNEWSTSSSINPDSSTYDGVYVSTNTGRNSMSKMYIDIEGYTYFRFYIRCHTEDEARYDYVLVSQLDRTITSSSNYSSPEIYTSTYDFSNAGTTIDCYKLVEFFYVDGGKHRITIAYIKDDDGTEGSNKGYVLIPKDQ